jgi:hypothetical protein
LINKGSDTNKPIVGVSDTKLPYAENYTEESKYLIKSAKQISSTQVKHSKAKDNNAFSGNLINKIKDQRASQQLQKAIQKASESTILMVINKVFDLADR